MLAGIDFALNILIFLNWGIIALQCGGGLWCTSMQIHHNFIHIYKFYIYIYTHTHPYLLSLPHSHSSLEVVTELQAGRPVFYSSFQIVIYFKTVSFR